MTQPVDVRRRPEEGRRRVRVPWQHPRSRCLGGDRGSVTVQYAIIVPSVLALLFLCVQVALFSYARSVALTAAQEGANAQRAYGSSAGAGAARANSVIDRQGDTLRGVKITVNTTGGEVRVTVTGHSLSVLPGFAGYPISQTASGPIEAFNR